MLTEDKVKLATDLLKLDRRPEYFEAEGAALRCVRVLEWIIPNLSPEAHPSDRADLKTVRDHILKADGTFLPFIEQVETLKTTPHSPLYIRARRPMGPFLSDFREVAAWLFLLCPKTHYWLEYAVSFEVSKLILIPDIKTEEDVKTLREREKANIEYIIKKLNENVLNWASAFEGRPKLRFEGEARYLIMPPRELLDYHGITFDE